MPRRGLLLGLAAMLLPSVALAARKGCGPARRNRRRRRRA